MAESKHSISGSWLGNYYYDAGGQPFSFEAVFVESNGVLEGSILDDGRLKEARVFGDFASPNVTFTKKYMSGAHHPVSYQGTMSDEGKKLSGTWNISTLTSGKWLAWRQEEEDIPELETEDERQKGLYRNEEKEKVMALPLPSKQK